MVKLVVSLIQIYDEYANGEGSIDFLLPMGVLIGMTIISGDYYICYSSTVYVSCTICTKK